MKSETNNTEVIENVATEVTETKETEQITNQKDFNSALKTRLEKERAKQAELYAEKYKDYLSPEDLKTKTEELNNRISELGNSLEDANTKATTDAQTIADLEARVKQFESASLKSRIAHEVGIPYELANKLSGESEEEIREDASRLLPFVTQKQVTPLRNAESKTESDGVLAAFRALNPNLDI